MTSGHVGLVRIGRHRMAIPAELLAEVVPRPPTFVPLPQTPALVLGGMVRGHDCIPVIDVSQLFKELGKVDDDRAAVEPTGGFVAIGHQQGRLIGLAVDETLKVTALRHLRVFQLDNTDGLDLFSGAFLDREDGALYSVLDFDRLSQLPGVSTCKPEPEPARANLAVDENESLRLALFTAAGRTFGIDRAAVIKAVPMANITAERSELGILLGHLREDGALIPVYSFSSFFALTGAESSGREIVIIKVGATLIGFAVDRVIGSTEERRSELQPLGQASHSTATPLVRCGTRMLKSREHGLLFVLQVSALVQHGEIERVGARDDRHAASQTTAETATGEKIRPENFVTFLLSRYQFCTPLREVDAIESFAGMTEFGAPGEYFRGVLEWRGSLVNVFDLRVKLGVAAAPAPESQQLLIVRQASGWSGFLIDAVDRLQPGIAQPAPTLVSMSWPGSWSREMICVPEPTGGHRNINIVHLGELESEPVGTTFGS